MIGSAVTGIDRVYLDTNVLIRAFEADDDVAGRLRELLLHASRRSRSFLATSELALLELLVVPLRSRDHRRIAAYRTWLAAEGPLLIGSVARDVLSAAACLRAEGRLKLADAIHAATALALGCSHFLTADTDFVEEIRLDDGLKTLAFASDEQAGADPFGGRRCLTIAPSDDNLQRLLDAAEMKNDR